MSESSQDTTDSSGSTDLPANERYRLLAADRRRLALDILVARTTPIELEELAAGIASREDGSSSVDEETIERVAITLHHTHLPKLAEVGVLDYNPESHLIDPDGTFHSTGDGPISPSTDEQAAFADQHRRLVLEVLAETERITLEELSTTLADEDTREVDAQADVIATRLHHNHLPRLDDMGFVCYDPDDHTVKATEQITG